MTPVADPAPAPTSNKRGPQTPEGKARSSKNALRHGLRARTFGLLPEEEQAEWAEHLHDLRAGYGPVDAAEGKLVAAIAAAMWQEFRADRTLAEVLAAIPPLAPGRPHGGDLQEPRARALAGHRPALPDRRRHGGAARPARVPRPPQGQAEGPAPAVPAGPAG